jgi:hypothetical protein
VRVCRRNALRRRDGLRPAAAKTATDRGARYELEWPSGGAECNSVPLLRANVSRAPRAGSLGAATCLDGPPRLAQTRLAHKEAAAPKKEAKNSPLRRPF